MKRSVIQLFFLLLLIVSVSVYMGQKTFANELTVYSRGVDTDGSFQLGSVPTPFESFVGTAPAAPVAPVAAVAPVAKSTVVPVSATAYDAMSLKQRSDMLKEIQGLVRNELLAARRRVDRREEEEEEEDEDDDWSHANRQGVDFNRRCNKPSEEEYRCPKNPNGSCPPVPDLSNYIRKDQIPCWGCSVDY